METPKPQRKRWIILMVTAAFTFMSTLDSSIVNVALPKMAEELKVSTGTVTWVVSVYLIALSVFTLLFGHLGDMKGQERTFRFGLFIFTVGSLLCGVVATFPLLIAARVLQAAGASAGLANSQGIITRTFPAQERGRALGINGAFVALGMLAGPALGGLIISFADWRYLFWVNVPIGFVAYIANVKFSTKSSPKTGGKFDAAGFVLFSLVLVPAFAALEYGQNAGYGSLWIIACFFVSGVSAVIFFIVEKRCRQPLLDFSIFHDRMFTISIFCAFTSFVAISCSNIILPFYLQDILSMSPGQAGMYMAVYPAILAVAAPVSGYISDKTGPEILTAAGLMATSVGLYLMAGLNESSSHLTIIFFIGVMSLGNGLFQSPNNALVMSLLPEEKLGAGGSINALVRNVGMVTGVTLSTAILYSTMSIKTGRHVTGYVKGESGAFLFGMRAAYIMAASICLLGAVLTAVRLFLQRKRKGAEKK